MFDHAVTNGRRGLFFDLELVLVHVHVLAPGPGRGPDLSDRRVSVD
jgi:hypothetical protein